MGGRRVTIFVFFKLVTAVTAAADATEVAELMSRSAARTPPSTRAGDQDDVS